MNFTTMDYFIALAEELSFTRAASRLSITQQTLSAHIQRTEEELGVRLINRTVPLTLTYAGQIFLNHAKSMQAQERAMVQEFKDIANDERGLLAIGIASTRGKAFMPALLASFQDEHKGINTMLLEDENERIIEHLREGRCDMCVAIMDGSKNQYPDLVVRPLYKEKIVLCVNQDLLHELYQDGVEERIADVEKTGNLEALRDCPYLMLGIHDEPGGFAHSLLQRSGVKAWERVRSSNTETLISLAARGVGACFAPSYVVHMLKAQGVPKLRAISLGKKAELPISCAWKQSAHTWSVINSFYFHMLNELADDEKRVRLATEAIV